ncbi:MAG: MaoC/PaaZ C-terminal domain-containing protein [Allopontixanthobacter sediminis]
MDQRRDLRKFDDLTVGERRQSAKRTVSEMELLEFARQYDPQWFHADPELARESHFGGLIASGVHVLAIWRQLDHTINGDVDFVCGIGFDDFRLVTALRAGDSVYVTSEIVSLTLSSSGKQRGTAITHYEMRNQNNEIIVRFDSINLVYRRTV